jgi:hypothetical protein
MADLSKTATNVLAGVRAKTLDGIFGEACEAGDPLYQDSATQRWYKCDANVLAKSSFHGFALNGGAAGQPVKVDYEDDDYTPGVALSLSIAAGNEIVILSPTPGGLGRHSERAAGTYLTIIGIAKSTTKMSFRRNGLSSGVPLVA